ncbi:MAG TPA: hypothetical protein PLB02_08385 [Thermoanaerobaculia bacterium]|nr:hypothetical protein [Thermoanaerobaculia bacterium]HQR67396.1 hypothetical protein [Thermoanaerobaculia bacterium]
MRTVAIATIAVLLIGSVTPAAFAAEPPKITHATEACVPAEGNVRVSVIVTSSSSVISARVYFHSTARKTGDYYLELRQGENNVYWAILPYPVTETSSVQYRIVVKNADGLEASTEPYTVPTATACTLTLTGDETRYANNLVIGLTSDTQPGVPDGFKCKGVVSKITVNGEMKPSEECRQAGAVVAAGAPIPIVPWIVGSAALVAGGATIASYQSSCKCEPVSCPRCVTTGSTGGTAVASTNAKK